MKFEVYQTSDGSNTFFIPEMNEFFHSPKGALSESKYVFIEKGLMSLFNFIPTKERITILEIGFGTGLNAILTNIYATDYNQKIFYESIDKYPLDDKKLEEINYSSIINNGNIEQIYKAEWEIEKEINPFFTILKKNMDLLEFKSEKKFDLVYFDAFAPSKQSELWTVEALSKLNNFLNKNAVLVTYCAQGQFKRNFRELGWEIESLQGANGKREMVRAFLKSK